MAELVARLGGLRPSLKDRERCSLPAMQTLGGAFVADGVIKGSTICPHEEEAMAGRLEQRL